MDEYEISSKVIEKLIEIEKKIFESYQDLFVFSELPTNLCAKEKERLKVLIKKENILTSKLPQNSYIISYIFNIVNQNQQNYFDDEKSASLVMDRFTNVLSDMVNLLSDEEDAELFEEEDIDIYDDLQASMRISIRDNIILKYLKWLEDLPLSSSEINKPIIKNVQYFEAFRYKNIGDFLLENDFNINNVSYQTDLEMSKTLNLSFDDYNSIKNDELFNMTQEVFFMLLSNVCTENNLDNNLLLFYDSLKFKFYLHEMPTPLLMTIDEFISENIDQFEDNENLIKELYGLVTDELSNRTDIPKKNEENPLRIPIDPVTADSIIELIKLEEKMLAIFDEIEFDDINNISQIKTLAALVEMEKELSSKIKIDYKNVDVIEDMLINDMNFFLTEDESSKQIRKEELIYERIHDLLPFYQKMELSPSQSQVSYSCISQNHIIKTLKAFEKHINKFTVKEEADSLKNFYKELFFVNVGLMNDYIYADGNYKIIDCFSDKISSQSVGISEIEYSFDKDEQLYERAKFLIDEVLSYEDEWDKNLDVWAAVEFKLLELRDIIKNISDEHFYELPYLVKENNTYKSTKTKKKLLKIIKR